MDLTRGLRTWVYGFFLPNTLFLNTLEAALINWGLIITSLEHRRLKILLTYLFNNSEWTSRHYNCFCNIVFHLFMTFFLFIFLIFSLLFLLLVCFIVWFYLSWIGVVLCRLMIVRYILCSFLYCSLSGFRRVRVIEFSYISFVFDWMFGSEFRTATTHMGLG